MWAIASRSLPKHRPAAVNQEKLMFKGLRTVLVIGALLVGGAAIVRLITERQVAQAAAASAAAVVDTTVADRGDIPITIAATGNIDAQQDVALAFPTSGKVT